MADKATALETYKELGTGGIAADVCVDRSVEGRREEGRLAVADEVTASVLSCLILPRIISSHLILSHLNSSHIVSSCLILYRLVSSHLALSCLEGGLQWQRRPLPQKLMRYQGCVEALSIFVWTG